jgi:hypothetical protein
MPRKMKRFTSFCSTIFHSHTRFIRVKKPGDIRDWQVRAVCEIVCNNGWMRKVDERARPIMTSLIKGEEIRLGPDEQLAVAVWAALKAMVAEYSEADEVTTHHHTQRKRLMNKCKPPETGWGIWIGRYVRMDWPIRWASTPFLLLPDKSVTKRAHRRATYYNSHSTTQIIGQLLIQMIHTSMPNSSSDGDFRFPVGWPSSVYGLHRPIASVGRAELLMIWPQRESPLPLEISWQPLRPKGLAGRRQPPHVISGGLSEFVGN